MASPVRWEGQFFNAQDALKERPPREFLVRPIFPIPSFSLVFGYPGTFKTNLLADLVACVLTGSRWLAGEQVAGYETAPTGVLWCDADSGPEYLHEHLGAALRGHGGTPGANLHYLSFPSPMFDPIHDKDGSILITVTYALKFHARLIVFDNLGVFSGGADENSSQMIHVTNAMREIATRANAAVITIHHDVKNGEDRRKSPRGHSSIEAALDLALNVTVEDKSDTIRLTPTKQRNRPVDPFYAYFEYSQNKTTEQLDWLRFAGLAPELDAVSQKCEQLVVTHLLRYKSANQTELLEMCVKGGVKKHRAMSELRRMARDNKIKQKANQAHNQSVFSL